MEEIQEQIATIFIAAANGEDPEMQSLLERHVQSMPFDEESADDGTTTAVRPSEHPDADDSSDEDGTYPTPVRRIAEFMIQFVPHRRPSAHEALRFLAESDWDNSRATINIHNSRMTTASEGYESEEEADTASLNSNVDRAPAVKGRVTPSKGTITITLLNGRRKTTRFAGVKTMDWNDAEHIHLLNRWRAQFFRRNVGNSRDPRVTFTQEEKDWLITYIKDFRSGHQNRHGTEYKVDYSLMDFYKCTTLFNRRFAGKTLHGTTEPRPIRSRMAVDSGMRRIPEINQITGWKPKGQRKKSVRKEGDEQEDEDEDEDEDDEDGENDDDDDDGDGDEMEGKGKKKLKKKDE